MGYHKGLKLIGSYWHYRFKQDGVLYRGSTNCSSLPDAQKWLKRKEAKLTMEGVGVRKVPTLRQLLEKWAEAAKSSNQKSQIDSMRSAILKHFHTLLGLPVDRLSTEKVQAVLLRYLQSEGIGPGRRKHTTGGANALLLRLNTLLGWAIRSCYILKKPHSVRRFRRQDQPRPVVRGGQARDFLEAVEKITTSEDLHLAVALMLGLGLRESEALGVRWEYMDLNLGYLNVGRLVNGTFRTKGGEVRQLPVQPGLLERLKRRWEKDGKPTKGLVMPGPVEIVDGKKVVYPHSSGFTRKIVKKVGDEVGLPGLTPHRLRASFASSLVLEVGISLPQTKELLGHKHIETTMRYITGADSHADAIGALGRLQNL